MEISSFWSGTLWSSPIWNPKWFLSEVVTNHRLWKSHHTKLVLLHWHSTLRKHLRIIINSLVLLAISSLRNLRTILELLSLHHLLWLHQHCLVSGMHLLGTGIHRLARHLLINLRRIAHHHIRLRWHTNHLLLDLFLLIVVHIFLQINFLYCYGQFSFFVKYR